MMNILKKVLIFVFIVILIISISTNVFGVTEWPDFDVSEDKITSFGISSFRTIEYIVFFAGIILASINVVLFIKNKENNGKNIFFLIIFLALLQFLSLVLCDSLTYGKHIDYVPSLIDYIIPILPIVPLIFQVIMTIILIKNIKKKNKDERAD